MKKLATIITLVMALIAGGAITDAKTHSRTKTRSSSSSSRKKSSTTSGLRFTISSQGKFTPCSKYYIDEENLPVEDVYTFEDVFSLSISDENYEACSFSYIISIPKNFPSEVVKNIVLNKANDACELLFDIENNVKNGDEEYNKLVNSSDYSFNSTETFIQKWEQIFNIHSQEYSIKKNYYSDTEFFLHKFLCNQIYEDSKYVTYVFLNLSEDSITGGEFYDLEYVTYDKSTGKILKFSDINFTNGKEVLKQKLQAIYKAEAKAADLVPERISSSTWFKELLGVALVNEGLMFCYPTYTLGPKYMGSNLIIPGKLSVK